MNLILLHFMVIAILLPKPAQCFSLEKLAKNGVLSKKETLTYSELHKKYPGFAHFLEELKLVKPYQGIEFFTQFRLIHYQKNNIAKESDNGKSVILKFLDISIDDSKENSHFCRGPYLSGKCHYSIDQNIFSYTSDEEVLNIIELSKDRYPVNKSAQLSVAVKIQKSRSVFFHIGHLNHIPPQGWIETKILIKVL